MAKYNVRDAVKGVVVGGDWRGVYLQLDDGDCAFASFGSLSIGTKVVATVLKHPTDFRPMLVSIDAVLGDDRRAA